jgi:mercuric ion transport protein
MKIELVYFEGCPNAGAARENLRKACGELSVKAEWQEWDQNSDSVPDHVKPFGSPSILVNGKDIAGGPGECCAEKSCRLYEGGQNAPAVETIKAALREGLRP